MKTLFIASLLAIFALVANAHYICPPGWTQGEVIIHTENINGTDVTYTIYWCYKNNGNPHMDIIIGSWEIYPYHSDYEITFEDALKLIMIYQSYEIGFPDGFIPPCPQATEDIHVVYSGGCLNGVLIPVDEWTAKYVYEPCGENGFGFDLCWEGYTYCLQLAPSGAMELVVTPHGPYYGFTCEPKFGEDNCRPACEIGND